MVTELTLLIATSASLGLIHTLLGPDHYLPFIMMSKAGEWTKGKTALVTILCGLGHVGSSILIGTVGIGLGISIEKISFFETFRGGIAAWLLAGFGIVYFIWGVRKIIRNIPHKHLHIHEDGVVHTHEHVHKETHLHVHSDQKAKKITPWVLFVIFILGPCEPLIPLLMYPAAQSSWMGMGLVALVFCIITLATMMAMVMLTLYGFRFLPLQQMERYSHAVAGAAVFLCGFGMIFLGL